MEPPWASAQATGGARRSEPRTSTEREREREREPVWCRVVGGGLTSHLSVGVALVPVLLSLRHDGVCRPPVGLRNGFGQGPSAAHHHKLLVRLHPDLQQQRSHGRKQGGVWSSVRTRVQKKSGVRWSRSHAIRVSSVESLHTLVQSESSFSVPPLTMIFCLSGGTPVREKSCILKSAGGWSVSISTGYIPLCHFTWTASRRVARKKKNRTHASEQERV